jgi:hypothetical protein
MSISDVRVLLGDMPKFDRQTAAGDGATALFVASSLPIITSTETVTVGGAVKTKPTDYSIDYDLGLITFAVAPGASSPIVTTFQYAEISNESLTALLALQPDAYRAAALAARSISGRYSSLVDKQVGDLKISFSQRAKTWMDLAQKLESAPPVILPGQGVWLGGSSVADKDANEIDTSLTKPFFRRNMMENPPRSNSRPDTI